jgi:hypothetical protein
MSILLDYYFGSFIGKYRAVRFDVFTAVSMKMVPIWDKKPSSYLTGDTLRLSYIVQPFNAM